MLVRISSSDLPRPAIGELQRIQRGGATLAFYVRGEGETVVLLPAFGRAASDFNEFAEALNHHGYRTVALEFRGMGLSDGPRLPRPSLRDLAEDVAAVIDQVEPDPTTRVHIVGQAMGNRVGRLLATCRPERVASLTLLAAGGLVPPLKGTILRMAIRRMCIWSRSVRRRALEEALFAPGHRVPEHLDYRITWRAFRQQAPAVHTARLEDWWHGGEAPMLVLQGEHDRIAPPANGEVLKRDHPDRVDLVTLPDAAHALLVEQPGLVLQHVLNFLRRHALSTVPS